MFSVYSASISAFLTINLELLIGWLVICTVAILVPVAWWMPLISQKRAEKIVEQYAKKKKPNAAISIRKERTKLDGWTWHVTGDFEQGIPPHTLSAPFTVVVSAKWGTIKLSKYL